jgi:16S rRNA (adenine1518-N6/adenine1519-N6)-dimethyltransferase
VIEVSGAEITASSAARLLRQFDIKPNKGLGQNFLTSEGVLRRIVDAAELSERDVIIEVGAGLGTLTRHLAEQAGQVIALEIDRRLLPVLVQALDKYSHVRIVHGDVLATRPEDLVSEPYKVVANLPYYITSAILRHFLEARVKPTRMVVTVQREVVERIMAKPGSMSLLAVSVQLYGEPSIVTKVPPGAFYPSPRVHSAVLRIDLYERPVVEVDDVKRFFEVVRSGFAQRRKQLRNSLAQGLGLPPRIVVDALHRSGIDAKQRPQELSIEQWAVLCRELTVGEPENRCLRS